MLVSRYPHLAQEPLSIKDVPEFSDLYIDLTISVEPAKDIKDDRFLGKGVFPRDPPYEDPFELQPEIPNTLGIKPIPDSEIDDSVQNQIQSLRRQKQDIKEPTLHIRALMYVQDGSPGMTEELQDFIDKYSSEHPTNVKVATYALRALKAAYQHMKSPQVKQDCVEGGHFALILKLMAVAPRSSKLQSAGIEAFFHVMGSYGIDESLPLPPVMERGRLVGGHFHRVIKTTLLSLTTAPEHVDLQTLLKAMRTVVEYYHTSMLDMRQRLARSVGEKCVSVEGRD
jgi:hypothetical protein